MTKSFPHFDRARGRDVILLGSAPGADLPTQTFDKLTVFVNAAALGLEVPVTPDILVLGSATASQVNPASRLTAPRISELSCDHLVVMESVPLAEVAHVLAGVKANHRAIIPAFARKSILMEMLPWSMKEPETYHDISTGCVTLLLLMRAGARSIEVSGFSLGGGHSYLPAEATARDHPEQDARVFEWVKSLSQYNVTGLP